MFIPVSLALGALSGVTSLIESAESGIAKSGGNDPLSALAQAFTGDQPPADPAKKPAAGPFDSGTLATLISLQGQNGVNGAFGLFGKVDTDGDGSISKSEFESVLGNTGVDTNSADAPTATAPSARASSLQRAAITRTTMLITWAARAGAVRHRC